MASVPVARRQILADRRRLAISVLGIGAALGLILFLQGLWDGTLAQVAAYKERSGANLFVGDRGTRTSAESSVVPVSAVDAIRALPGVERADPVVSRFVIVELHGLKVAATLVGYRPGGLGGPWTLAAGRAVRSADEVVVDRVLAEEHGFRVGERFSVAGESYRVVGLSEGTRSWMTGYVFVSHAAAERLFRASGTTTFVLVRTDRPQATARAIERDLGLTALPTDRLVANDRELYAGIFQAPLGLMIAVAFAAGTLITALTVYSAVVERAREYGIAKAMGASRSRLFRLVLGQTGVLTALGGVAAFGMFAAFSRLIGAVRPRFWITWTSGAALRVVAAAALMSVVAAVVPTRRLSRLDPAAVYRG